MNSLQYGAGGDTQVDNSDHMVVFYRILTSVGAKVGDDKRFYNATKSTIIVSTCCNLFMNGCEGYYRYLNRYLECIRRAW